MQTVSPEFVAALRGSTNPVITVDVWRDGELLVENIPVSDGSVTITGGQAIRSRVNLTITDPDGRWSPTKPSDALAPYGSEINVQAGLRLGQSSELVSLGWFPLMTAETQEQWVPYKRPLEPGRTYQVNRGQSTPVEAVDRAQLVAESRFLVATQPSKPTVLAEIAFLLADVVPWDPPVGIPDAGVPSTVTYDDDRLAAVQALADVVGAEFIMTPDGIGTLRATALTAPVWTVGGFSKASMVRSSSRDGIYNAVIFRGQTADMRVLQGAAYIPDGPLAWDGPIGRIPFFGASDFLSTQAQVDAAARTRLATLLASRKQEIAVEAVCNYALEVGDTVTLEAPRGNTPALVTEIVWPLKPGSMLLKLSVDPDNLAKVS